MDSSSEAHRPHHGDGLTLHPRTFAALLLDALTVSRDPESNRRTLPNGSTLGVDDDVVIHAVATLPRATLDRIAEHYPRITDNTRFHLSAVLGLHAAGTSWDMGDYAAAAVLGTEGYAVDPRGAAAIANAVAFAPVLDAIDEGGTGIWDETFGAAADRMIFALQFLKALDDRQSLTVTEQAEVDPRDFLRSYFTGTDYIATAEKWRFTAAWLLLTGLHRSVPRQPGEDIKPLIKFAYRHVHNPSAYAAAVREHRTYDPDVLRPILGDGSDDGDFNRDVLTYGR